MTGTIGLLLRLHGLGLASRTFVDDLRDLEDAGMRIAPAFRQTLAGADADDTDGAT